MLALAVKCWTDERFHFYGEVWGNFWAEWALGGSGHGVGRDLGMVGAAVLQPDGKPRHLRGEPVCARNAFTCVSTRA